MDDTAPSPNLPATDAPAQDDRIKEIVVGRMQEQFRQYAGANLRIEEADYILVDERGGIEYRCFTEQDALELGGDRVQRVGGPHTVFKRVAVLRPPKPTVEIDR